MQDVTERAPIKTNLLLVFLTILYMGHRLWVIWADVFGFFSWEELHTGNMAQLLFVIRDIPWYELSMASQEIIGRTTMALLVKLVFAFMNPSLFALKLPAVLMSGIAFFCWLKFLLRFAPLGILSITSMLWIFAPGFVIAPSVTSLGNHWFVLTFLGLALWAFTCWEQHSGIVSYIAMISLCGFSLSICLSSIPFVAGFLVSFVLFFRHRLKIHLWFIGGVAFVVGCIPSIWATWLRDKAFISIYNISSDNISATLSITAFLSRIARVFTSVIPTALNLEWYSGMQSNWRLLEFGLFVVFSVAALGCAVKYDKIRFIVSFYWISLLFFVSGWSVSGIIEPTGYFLLDFRYFAPLYFLLWMMPAIIMSSLCRNRKYIRCALCILVVLPTFIAGMSDQSHLANTPNKGLTLSFSGISWPNLSYWTLLNIKDHDHQKEMIRTLRTCSDDWRWQQFQLWFGRFYFQFNPAPADDRSPDDVLEFFEHKKEVISGAVSGMQIYKDMSTQEIYKRTSRYTGEMLEAVHEGIGMTAGLTDSDIPEGSMMDPYDLFAVRGFGRATAQNINRFRAGNLIETNQIMTSYPTSLRYAFAEGYGCGLAFNFPLQVNRVIAIIHDEFDEQYADVIEMYYLKYLDDYHPGLTCDYF